MGFFCVVGAVDSALNEWFEMIPENRQSTSPHVPRSDGD